MARPRKPVDAVEVLRLRLAGCSWPEVASKMKLGQGSVYRSYRESIDTLQPFQNLKAAQLKAAATNESQPPQHPAGNGKSLPRNAESLEPHRIRIVGAVSWRRSSVAQLSSRAIGTAPRDV